MDKFTKIGHSEVLALALVYTGTKVFLGLPRSFIEIGGTAGWTLPIFSGLWALLLWFLVAKLLDRFPGKSITQINNEVFGPIFALGINLLLTAFFILTNGNVLRQFGETMILTALPEAPISSLAFLFILPMAAAVYLGLEPIVRTNFISLPFIIFGAVGTLITLLPYWDFINIFPLFGNGLAKLAFYSLPLTSVYGETLILAVLAPFFSFQGKKLAQVGAMNIIITALVFSVSTLVYQIVIPYPGSIESLLPYYQLARSIYLGRYFQRVEAIFVLFWAFSAFLRLSVGLFLACYLFMGTFRVPLLRPLIPALALILLSLALTPTDVMQTVVFEKLRILLGSLLYFGLPVFSLVIALLRGKGVKHGQVKN